MPQITAMTAIYLHLVDGQPPSKGCLDETYIIGAVAHGPKSVATLILRIARRTALVASFMLYDHSNMAMYWPRNHLLTPRKLRKKFRAPVHNPSVVLLWVQPVWLQRPCDRKPLN